MRGALSSLRLNPKGLLLWGCLLVVFVPAYHWAIEASIRRHPETTLLAAREHCRYRLGQQLGTMPKSDFAAEFARCDEIRVKSVEAAGGVWDPVVVRITLEEQPRPPLGLQVLVFKSAEVNPRHFNFLSSLGSLATGRWTFNFYTSYSSTTFHGSF